MIKTLSKSIREYKKASILTPVLVALEVIMECILPFLMSLLLDNMEKNEIGLMIGIISLLIVVAMLGLVFGFLSGKYAAEASAGFAKNLRKDMYYKIQDFSFENIDRFSASSLVTRMTTDVSNMQQAYGMLIRVAVRSPLMLIFSIIMAYVTNAKLATILLIMVPIVALVFVVIIKFAMPLFDKVFKKYDALNESIQENIKGIRVVKSYVREDFEQDKFNKAADDVCKDFTKAEKIVAFNTPTMQFAIYAAMTIICIFGAYLAVQSGGVDMSTGKLQSLIMYGMQILNSLMMLSMIFVMLSISVAGGKRIAEVLEEQSTLVNPENPIYEVLDGKIGRAHV